MTLSSITNIVKNPTSFIPNSAKNVLSKVTGVFREAIKAHPYIATGIAIAAVAGGLYRGRATIATLFNSVVSKIQHCWSGLKNPFSGSSNTGASQLTGEAKEG